MKLELISIITDVRIFDYSSRVLPLGAWVPAELHRPTNLPNRQVGRPSRKCVCDKFFSELESASSFQCLFYFDEISTLLIFGSLLIPILPCVD